MRWNSKVAVTAVIAILAIAVLAASAAKASAEAHVDHWRNEFVRAETAYDKASMVTYQMNYHLAPTVQKNDALNFKLFKVWWCTDDDNKTPIKNCVVGVNKEKPFNSNTFIQWYRVNLGRIFYDQVIQTPGWGGSGQGTGDDTQITKGTVKVWISNGYNAWLQTGGKSIHTDCGGYCY